MQRREFVLLAPAAALLAACGGDPETGGPAGDVVDVPVLEAALELEQASAALYEVGLEAAPRRRRLIEPILEHERAHVAGIREALADLRGRPVAVEPLTRFRRRLPRLRDEDAFLEHARAWERHSVESYLAGVAKARNRRLRGTLAAVLAAEAEHAALLAEARGGDPLEPVVGP